MPRMMYQLREMASACHLFSITSFFFFFSLFVSSPYLILLSFLLLLFTPSHLCFLFFSHCSFFCRFFFLLKHTLVSLISFLFSSLSLFCSSLLFLSHFSPHGGLTERNCMSQRTGGASERKRASDELGLTFHLSPFGCRCAAGPGGPEDRVHAGLPRRVRRTDGQRGRCCADQHCAQGDQGLVGGTVYTPAPNASGPT